MALKKHIWFHFSMENFQYAFAHYCYFWVAHLFNNAISISLFLSDTFICICFKCSGDTWRCVFVGEEMMMMLMMLMMMTQLKTFFSNADFDVVIYWLCMLMNSTRKQCLLFQAVWFLHFKMVILVYYTLFWTS